jgi:hypothetical protein
MEGSPPVTEINCEHIEQAVADSDKGWSSSLGVGKLFKAPRTWTDSLTRPKQWKKYKKFGTWNVMNLCRLDLAETGIDGSNRIRLAQDRVKWLIFVKAVMNLRAPQRKQDIF